MTYIERIFSAAIFARGGPVRRNSTTIRRMGLEAALLAEVQRRQAHMIENGGQLIITRSPTITLHT